MKTISPLRVFATYYVDLQESLSNSEKFQLRTFIKSANQHQIIALITEGKMRTIKPVEESLLESSIMNSGMGFLLESSMQDNISNVGKAISHKLDSINKHIEIFGHKAEDMTVNQWNTLKKMVRQGHLPEINKPLAAAALAALILTTGYVIYKKYLSKAAQACKGTSGAKRYACEKKYKTDAIKAQIATLVKNKQACRKSKNVAKCNANIESKIKKLRNKLA